MHNKICLLVRKKCHPKSYHSHIKYCVTLSIILSVVAIKSHTLGSSGETEKNLGTLEE